jgi:aminoglycoside phosphotransferase (APT) family kinase protein
VVEPWEAERAVGDREARRLVESRFPELSGATIEPYGVGWDNTAYLVDGEWVFRFPRRRIAVPFIEREARVLPALAPLLPIPIPVPDKVGAGDAEYPWPFSGYRRIPGRTLDHAALSADARASLAEPLAALLRALHAVPPAWAESLGAGRDEIGRLDVPARIGKTRSTFDALAARSALSIDVRHALDRAMAETPAGPPRRLVLCHGDLYARHLLVDDRGALCGVIDWGDVHLGDPAVDLSVAYLVLPPAARDRFLEAYAGADPTDRLRARARAIFHASATLRFAVEVADEDLRRECALALDWISDQYGQLP